MARGRMRPVDIEDERGDCHRQVIRLPRQPESRWSEEASYGVHRRLQGWPHKWRVSYVRATGEIYAADQGLQLHNAVDRTLAYGPLYVIGHVEARSGTRGRPEVAVLRHPRADSGRLGRNVAGRRTD